MFFFRPLKKESIIKEEKIIKGVINWDVMDVCDWLETKSKLMQLSLNITPFSILLYYIYNTYI